MEKGGLGAALTQAAVSAGQALGHLDEMRLGLVGATRRRWGIRGVKIVQPLQRRYEWSYLVLLVDGEHGQVWWTWQPTMRSDDLLVSLAELRVPDHVAAVVWDGAPAHRERRVRALGLPLVELPPYSPELNPAERIFEEIRRQVEGEVYTTLADKQAAVEAYLRELAAAPDRVRALAGWEWIHDTLIHLAA
jgi:hypothetical protein